MPKIMSELKFSAGKAVEVSLHGEDSLDTWYPATVIKEAGKGSFLVEYKKTDEAGPVQVVVDSHHIRPSPPACVNATFQLLEKVDAFCNFGWSSGVVTKVLAEGRYIVYFKRTRKEKELRHTDLRIPMVQSHGKWVLSSQDAAPAVIPNSHESKDTNLVGNGKISLPPENPGIVKKSEEVRNGQKVQAKAVSSMTNEGDAKNKAPRDRPTRKKPRRDKTFKELNAKPAPEELQSSQQGRETQMTETEKKDTGIVKESDEARNGQKEQAITVSSMVKEEDNNPMHDRTTKKKARRDRTVKELNTDSTPKVSQSSLQVSETQMAQTEQLDQEETLDTPDSDKANTSSEQSESGNQDSAKFASPERDLEVSEEKIDPPTNKGIPFRGGRGRGRGRARGSRPITPRASVAGAVANQLPISFAESFQGSIGKSIVISLPCYNNSKWNKLLGQGTTNLPINTATEGQEEETQLPSHVSEGNTVNTVNHGKPETEGVNNENSTTPRRKRGRPFGSFSAPGKKRVKQPEEVVVTIVSSSSGLRRKSTRERREVYKSAIDSLRPRSKKLRRISEEPSPAQEIEANLNEKGGAVVTYSLGFVDPVSNQPIPDELISQGVYVNISDIDEEDDRPLSTWIGEAHSLPNYSKPSSVGNTSQNGKAVTKIDQRQVFQRNETTGGAVANLAQSASQGENGTGKAVTKFDQRQVVQRNETTGGAVANLAQSTSQGENGTGKAVTKIDQRQVVQRNETTGGAVANLAQSASQGESGTGKAVTKIDQRQVVQHNETVQRNETTRGAVANLAQSASQGENGTGKEREGEKMTTDIVLKGLPFSKISPIWKVIESMEVFKQIPQNPHFQPLFDIKEHCREGLAICSMVTFSRLAEDVCKFQFDEPNNILEDSMETLSELERQGFNVESIRSRLIALLSLKTGHGPAQSMEKEIAKEEKERGKIVEQIDVLERKMAALREMLAVVEREREKKDSKIGELQSRYDPLKDALAAARSEFVRLANAPW